jgi:NAD(P)H-flavin reductase
VSDWSAAPAPFARRLLSVLGTEVLGAYRVLRVADLETPEPRPGQFAMLATADSWGAGEDERPYLPRAFSYARWRAGEAHFLLEDVGPGTNRLCRLQEEEQLWALGPLGRGFDAPSDGRRAILAGGGVGIAPLAIWRDRLLRWDPDPPAVLLGFRDEAHAHGGALIEDALLATDDGTVGHHGQVTDLLRSQLHDDDHAIVYACGPPAMLEAIRELCADACVPAQLALEAGMACGFGACFGCVVQNRQGEYVRLCVDGPVLDASELARIPTGRGGAA